jgi:hypothetical protein
MAACAVVAGCAAPGAKGPSVEDQVRAHCERAYADARIDPIRAKVQLPLSFDDPQDVERLADRSFVTDAERPAVKALWEAKESCRREAERLLGPPPRYREVSEGQVSVALAELFDGEITYGQFARTMLFIGARDKSARETIDAEIRQREKWRDMTDYGR